MTYPKNLGEALVWIEDRYRGHKFTREELNGLIGSIARDGMEGFDRGCKKLGLLITKDVRMVIEAHSLAIVIASVEGMALLANSGATFPKIE